MACLFCVSDAEVANDKVWFIDIKAFIEAAIFDLFS